MNSIDRKKLIAGTKRAVIKIGSALLTTEKGMNAPFFTALAAEVKKLSEKKVEVVIVTSGAIACGMRLLGHTQRPVRLVQKQAAAAMGQPLLMQFYADAFQKVDRHVAQVLLTRDDVADRERFLTGKHLLLELIAEGAVPVINENDSVAVEEIQLGDNDQLSALVCHLVEADLLVMLSTTDGFYEKDPSKHGNSKLIPVVENVDDKAFGAASGTEDPKGTGGMVTKLMAARQAATHGVPTWLVNGTDPSVLQKVFAGEEIGTLFLPKAEKISAKKYWIAYAPKPKGEIAVDDGAAAALARKGGSLLSTGITEVRGEFGRGDLVVIVDPSGKPVARGLTGYGAHDLKKIKGVKSAEIAKVLGHKFEDEVVHRDDLVLV